MVEGMWIGSPDGSARQSFGSCPRLRMSQTFAERGPTLYMDDRLDAPRATIDPCRGGLVRWGGRAGHIERNFRWAPNPTGTRSGTNPTSRPRCKNSGSGSSGPDDTTPSSLQTIGDKDLRSQNQLHHEG